ncbi:ATP-binding protein [Thiohalocapsa halophila]|uniref:ATP-binding protein n=1 Tax=Thiohalocapsa halophila TaxID=69359 RepID=UPI001908D204|nr:ATP-binding protein [Thiohalocapsa halophila]
MLFDLFPAEEVGAARVDPREAVAPLHGLIQDFHVEYVEDATNVSWHRQPRHGSALPLVDAEELTDLLAILSERLSAAAATVATGETGLTLRPVVTLALGGEERALLHQVHEVSDWVMTLDRNLGIEFFDHGRMVNRPDYLIDHSPAGLELSGHKLVITSRSVTELEAMLRPVLRDYRLDADGRHAVAILEQLRSLSGRLALKLISAPTQRAEALGLALSRMYLEHQGAFENQIVIPLDAHLDLYRALKQKADELGEEVSFKRTDLALVDLDAAARVITCRLVEVKCWSQVGDLAAFNQLKTSVAAQIEQSQMVLAHHFDPHHTPADRPDRLVKTRELTALLELYLDRSERYGIIAPAAADEARFLLRTLEDGYRLAFTRSAVIFDFEKPGTEAPEMDQGVEYHRIGVDLIRQLVEAAAPSPETTIAPPSDLVMAAPEPERAPRGPELDERRERAPSVPTLTDAAFMNRMRDRTVSWERMEAGTGPDRAYRPDESSGSLTSKVADDDGSEGKAPHRHAAGRDDDPPAADRECVSRLDEGHPDVTAESHATPTNHIDEVAGTSSPRQEAAHPDNGPDYDVMLGVTGDSPQYGLLGECNSRKVALDLNQTHTISLFGVQGGGKSYSLGTTAEMASLVIPRINRLVQPLATVIFHYSPTMDYRPEFTSMVDPNDDNEQLGRLRERYGAEPAALEDVLLLVPSDKLEERRGEYPGLTVLPLKFSAAELQTAHWRFLMGAVGNQATYLRQLNRVMKSIRDEVTLEGLRAGIDASRLPDHLKELARMRLDLAAEYIDDGERLAELIRPGRLIIVDLRDEFIEKDEALGLFVVLLQLFADARYDGSSFNKLVVFDEAHKYIDSPDLVAGLVEVVREMRHKGTSILVASQDPPSVPVSLIELSSQVILHKFNSPAWLKHIQKANAALAGLTPSQMAHLKAGEAYVWSSKASDDAFSKGVVKVRMRPRVTRHGGGTKTAMGVTGLNPGPQQ